MFFLSEPSDAHVRDLLRRRADARFTYHDVGATREPLTDAPRGFVLDRYGAELGRGPDVFERARQAVMGLHNYPPSFTRIVWRDPGAPLAAGSLFATVASHYGFHSVHPCRVIYVVDEPGRFGLGFGTLPGHAEAGEECFSVRIGEAGDVRYDVQAFSRPRDPLARLGAPVARGLQRRFQRETLATMRRLCAEDPR